jgi:hypothetical protein
MCTYDGVRYEFSDKDWEELRGQIRELGRDRQLKAMNAAGQDQLSKLQVKV